RFATNEAARSGPVLYIVVAFLVGLLPWTMFLGRAMAPARSLRRENLRAHADELFLVLWIIVTILFFSVSRSKLLPYVLPAFPAAALLVGRAVACSIERADRWLGKVLWRHAVFWSVAARAAIAGAIHLGWL